MKTNKGRRIAYIGPSRLYVTFLLKQCFKKIHSDQNFHCRSVYSLVFTYFVSGVLEGVVGNGLHHTNTIRMYLIAIRKAVGAKARMRKETVIGGIEIFSFRTVNF